MAYRAVVTGLGSIVVAMNPLVQVLTYSNIYSRVARRADCCRVAGRSVPRPGRAVRYKPGRRDKVKIGILLSEALDRRIQ